jgi:hypothetical protein
VKLGPSRDDLQLYNSNTAPYTQTYFFQRWGDQSTCHTYFLLNVWKAIKIVAKIQEIHRGNPQPSLKFPKFAMLNSKCGCFPKQPTLGFVALISDERLEHKISM